MQQDAEMSSPALVRVVETQDHFTDFATVMDSCSKLQKHEFEGGEGSNQFAKTAENRYCVAG